ncbi:hypothetical protein [Negadavirga shengliensis]|uniref:DUF4145 domain-containing protein n=1 Tax=Negadavirga shengliensis TaxID=1389218 RepID=A0ABV9T741_9BACT
MEYIMDLLKVILPAGLAIYGMYIVAVSFLKKDREMKWMELKTKNTELVLPIRLQACERLCLLLERIMPNNLVRRVNDPTYTAGELHSRLVSEVRNEFNHNLSQQVYFSDEAWEGVRNAVEQVISIINRAYQEVDANAKSIELAKHIFQISLQQKNDFVALALKTVKSEIRVYF